MALPFTSTIFNSALQKYLKGLHITIIQEDSQFLRMILS